MSYRFMIEEDSDSYADSSRRCDAASGLDSAVSKTAEGNLVRVRLPLSAPRIRIQIDRILLSKCPKATGIGSRADLLGPDPINSES